MRKNSLILFIILISFGAAAQEGYVSIVESDVPATIDLKDDEEEQEAVELKEKRKKNVFYGMKTKKSFIRMGTGNKVTFEIFNYLPEWEEPNKYVPEIYWYDFKSRTIKTTKNVDKTYGVLLHGPYEKRVGDQIVEQGIFYKGMKHGRWEKHTTKDILIDKQKYYKGWPRESVVRYYGGDRKKLMEVVPIRFGQKDGRYYFFHKNGQVAVIGSYENDAKVGKWREYYPTRARRKREIQYADNPYDKNFVPYISKEWNRRGKVIYEADDD